MTMENLSQSEIRYDPKGSYLVFSADNRLFALPFQKIISVLDFPKTTMMPRMAEYMRGVMNFMGEPITMYDFRKTIGAVSMSDEITALSETLRQRKQDHLNWIAKLKEAVNTGAEITVETNPHKCAFGKWYDSFHTDNLALKRHLAKFDTPHQYIHGVASRAKQYITEGNQTAAQNLVRETEQGVLTQLVALFDETKAELQRAYTEYAIVVHADDSRKVALTVDEPRYFGALDEIIFPLSNLVDRHETGFVDAYGVLKSEGVDDEILIVALEKFLTEN
ncbi:MAG: CZB domain-containing protein [Desulfuromonadaceae bacterium]|nr:CZB domain-containing protein [Desulfuromonadaceae bacterium]MDD5107075.1 CZB domain-containing protein [Desulfuromonadaceae bacterium]